MTQAGFLETRRFNPGSLAMATAIEIAIIVSAVAWQIDVIVPPKPTLTDVKWVALPKDPAKHPDKPKDRPLTKHDPITDLPPIKTETVIEETKLTEAADPGPLSFGETGTGTIISDPQPDPPRILEPARARGDVRSLITTADYPESARRGAEMGTVRARLDIGANGKVTGCTIVVSSGSPVLDSTTCRLLRNRARFTPAKDGRGASVSDSYVTPKIVWTIARDG